MLTTVRRPTLPKIPRLDAPRWLGFSLVLMAEVSLLSLRFAIPRFDGPVPWWLWPLDHLRYLLVPVGLGLVATAYLSDAREGSAVARLGGEADGATGRWALHGLAVLGFVALSGRVLEGGRLDHPDAAAWVLGWYAAGSAWLLSWQAALRPDGWGALLRPRGWLPLVVGVAVVQGTCTLRTVAAGSWFTLARGTLVLVRLALGTVTPVVVYDPDRCVIGTGTFAVWIAPYCSGIEGIGLVGAFLLVYLTVARRTLRWPQAFWLVPIGVLAIWLVNAARIAVLILIGSWWSPEVALGGFHSQAGSLGFLVVALGLLALSRSCRAFRAGSPVDDGRSSAAIGPDAPTAIANPTAAHLLPFLAIVATTMATGALLAAPGFDPLYPLRIVAGALALAWCRRGVPGRWFEGGAWAVGAGLLVLAAWLILEPAPTGPSSLGADLARLGPLGAGVWLACRVVGSAVVVPLAEEWAFRGYLARRLIARDFESVPPGRFTWASFLGSSLLFGLLHGRWVAGTLAGLVYAGVYCRRGRVGDAVLAHVVTNAGIAALVLATGDGRYWS